MRDIETIQADIKRCESDIETAALARAEGEKAMRAAKKRLDNFRSELLAAYQAQAEKKPKK